ncbi:ABC transporter substrate-binding protein [Clostridium sp. CS001]|uniref:ABC transporter substrate-binding protein n=1 Tax=Clostridium sp. CS001 TaxID=2880648 RepID=UPI001CF2A47A|nr:ABC transporter substrate-binding protein [Clostridium sp. CS001]MCB2289419.1 ABC transporter substrate-binding protein [Clostridium sp. CS001]
MKKILKVILVSMIILCLVGCNKDSGTSTKVSPKNDNNTKKISSIEVVGDKYPLTVKDYLKDETILNKKPEKVAVLSGTPLNIWYDLGGKSIGTSNISDNLKLIPEYKNEILKLPTVGVVYSIDMEAVVALKPDLIIAQVGTQGTQAKKLREMGFNVISTYIRGFDDVLSTYKAFGQILGQQEKAEERINELKTTKENIVSKLPSEEKSVAILYVTAKSVSVKLDISIAGDVARILKLKNIASDLPPDTIGSETTPLDIEYIVGKNPDYILVASMVSDDKEAKRTMEEQFEKNPVWKGVKAITEGRVIYLPQQYFLYNSGPYYGEAIEYVARSIYPSIYGKVEDFYGK